MLFRFGDWCRTCLLNPQPLPSSALSSSLGVKGLPAPSDTVDAQDRQHDFSIPEIPIYGYLCTYGHARFQVSTPKP